MLICGCDNEAKIKTSWTDRNPERRFYGSRNKARNYGFFWWVDTPMSERDVDVIPRLLMARNVLEEDLEDHQRMTARVLKNLSLGKDVHSRSSDVAATVNAASFGELTQPIVSMMNPSSMPVGIFKVLSNTSPRSSMLTIEPVGSGLVEGDGIGVLMFAGMFTSSKEVHSNMSQDCGNITNHATVTKESETDFDLISSSFHVPSVPGTANVVDLFGVPLNTLGDIDNLTKYIELGKYEVWSDFPSEKYTKVIDTIWAIWDDFVAENNNVTSGYSLDSGKYDPPESRVNGFSEDKLSIIASQIGKHIMLESYTSSMCIESWGRSSFARCLIEINADDVLKESLTMGVPLIEGSGFTIETVTIEYEWEPPHCDLCKIFGHVHDHCLKTMSVPPSIVTHNAVTPTVEKTNDGFQTASTSVPNKGATNLVNASKSSSMSKNEPPKATVTSTKEGESSYTFTAVAG
uniref:Zinc knuckle CX2CX4HX4C n=1 Tax=Tanacetum cinerariifolium TaxID=118510 RepID=A0A699IHM6_TANCI|nr:hypothetical protein [Tanacetum cinerariifolium]